MKYNQYIFIFILIAGLFLPLSGQGQGGKGVVQFTQSGITYQGNFNWAFLRNPDFSVSKQQDQYIVEYSNPEKPKEFALELKDLIWVGLPDSLKGKVKVVIKKEWIKRGTMVLKSPTRPYNELRPNGKLYLEFSNIKNTKEELAISYGVKLPGMTNGLVKRSGRVSIQYEIRDKTKPSPNSSSTDITPEPPPPSDAQIAWKNCIDAEFTINCIKAYIRRFPNGENISEARTRYKTFDDQQWAEAQRGDTKEDYDTYIQLMPEGAFVAQARTALQRFSQQPVKTPPPAAQPSPRDLFNAEWNTVKNQHTVKGYQDFINKYKNQHPNSPFINQAIDYSEKIELSYDDSLGVNIYRFSLNHAINPTIDSIVPREGVNQDLSKFRKQDGYRFILEITDDSKHTLYISDKSKPFGVSVVDPFEMDNLLKAEMEKSETGDTLMFTFRKGTPPYTLTFKKGNENIFISASTRETNFQVFKKDITKKMSASDTLDVKAWDAKAKAGYSLGKIFIEKNIFPIHYILLGVGAFFLLFVLFRRMSQRGKQKKLQALNEQRKKERIQEDVLVQEEIQEVENSPEESLNMDETNIEEETNPIPETETVEPPLVTMEDSEKEEDEKLSGLKIKKVRKAHLPQESGVDSTDGGMTTLPKEKYYILPQNVHWLDSVIKEIGFSKKSISSIDHFLRDPKFQTPFEDGVVMEEKEGAIPEIGGLLMGRGIHLKDTYSYLVTIEEFIPINPESNNVYRLEFSTQSLAKELGDAQDKFPGLLLVGWFHTHPGHGLFLSQPDLTIHEGFFRAPYQFAMEIDSRTANFDTGFFTRQKNGQVNNREHRKLNSPWFAWTEIEKFRRH